MLSNSMLRCRIPAEQVTGPAVLALSQMAQHEKCRHALGLAGGVPPLVFLCFNNQSPAVLTQVRDVRRVYFLHCISTCVVKSSGFVFRLSEALSSPVGEEVLRANVYCEDNNLF